MTMPSTPPRSGALPIFAVLAVALAAGLGLWASQRVFVSPTPSDLALQGTLLYPQPRPIPAFSLDGGDGKPFTEAELAGRWSLVFIGFTHCPDVCPTTLALLAKAVAPWQTEATAARPQVVFVSVDPERDSATKAAEYAAFFDPSIRAATADHARLQPFTRSLGMVYMQAAVEGGDYTVDHSSGLAVIDPRGRLVGLMRPPLEPARIAADLRALIEATP